jgi:single-strand DNA-binding protein
MAGSVNKVILVGNLGKDPEVRMTQGGQKIANITVATNESRFNKQTNQRDEHTEWHRLVLFGTQAEIVEKYLKKGSTAYFEGRLQTRKWTDKDNQERYTTEIVVDNFTMLGSKSGGSGASSGGDYQYDQSPKSGGNDFGSNFGGGSPKKISEDAPFDDEIPF